MLSSLESKTYRKDDSGLKAPLRFSGVLCGQTYKTDDSGIKAPLRFVETYKTESYGKWINCQPYTFFAFSKK